MILQGRYCDYPHFIDEKSEAQLLNKVPKVKAGWSQNFNRDTLNMYSLLLFYHHQEADLKYDTALFLSPVGDHYQISSRSPSENTVDLKHSLQYVFMGRNAAD